ncbi:MAG: DUF4160 domain-containing protein [Oligoflexia bacterium]|nr:DUF4160 domain-containing protein [Oligoflexia bacterium]
MDIKTLGIIDGHLPPKVRSLVIEWASIHKEELENDWNLLVQHKPPLKITPLE